mmetsp:Transcript_15044/g.39748  ORF Transcript_15044/g.39748 Transcript_15044/m.39748 type:complete len:241 (+) Transcript_15044:469-1191(+)
MFSRTQGTCGSMSSKRSRMPSSSGSIAAKWPPSRILFIIPGTNLSNLSNRAKMPGACTTNRGAYFLSVANLAVRCCGGSVTNSAVMPNAAWVLLDIHLTLSSPLRSWNLYLLRNTFEDSFRALTKLPPWILGFGGGRRTSSWMISPRSRFSSWASSALWAKILRCSISRLSMSLFFLRKKRPTMALVRMHVTRRRRRRMVPLGAPPRRLAFCAQRRGLGLLTCQRWRLRHAAIRNDQFRW